MESIIVRQMKLPTTIRGFTVLDNESNYNVYLNALNNIEINQKALEHEIEHIENNDFFSIEDICRIENKNR